MGMEISQGFINFQENQQADPLRLSLNNSIANIELRFSGTITGAGAPMVLREDGCLNAVHRIQVRYNGMPIKTIGNGSRLGSGGRIAYYKNQIEEGYLPDINQPAVAVGTNAWDFTISLPFMMPQYFSLGLEDYARKATCLSPVTGDIEVVIDWGDHDDIDSSGNSNAMTGACEVIAEVLPVIDEISIRDQEIARACLYENTQQLGIQGGAGANTDNTQDITKLGQNFGAMWLHVDNSVRNDDTINNIEIKLNESTVILDGSWSAFKNKAKKTSGLQAGALPTGINRLWYDNDQDGSGAINLTENDIKAFKAHIDHDALTATNLTLLHSYFVQELPV